MSTTRATDVIRLDPPEHPAGVRGNVIGAARQRLGASSYQFLQTIDCWCEGRTLVLSGVVPSFYLKQVVQSLLKGIDGVERIDNRIDVVNPAGLSSVRPK